jgi:hypothetical protein
MDAYIAGAERTKGVSAQNLSFARFLFLTLDLGVDTSQ